VKVVSSAPRPRGLAAVSVERRAEISSRGGRATAQSAKAVRHITSENAREVGRKGGLAKAARIRDLSAAAE
jgi:general stress protein YciG